MNADELRYKMKHLGALCPNRSVANDEQFYELYSKFKDVIEDTEYELETIANAMDDYINYDDEKLDTESLFGGLSVSERVNSIQDKIDSILYN